MVFFKCLSNRRLYKVLLKSHVQAGFKMAQEQLCCLLKGAVHTKLRKLTPVCKAYLCSCIPCCVLVSVCQHCISHTFWCKTSLLVLKPLSHKHCTKLRLLSDTYATYKCIR